MRGPSQTRNEETGEGGATNPTLAADVVKPAATGAGRTTDLRKTDDGDPDQEIGREKTVIVTGVVSLKPNTPTAGKTGEPEKAEPRSGGQRLARGLRPGAKWTKSRRWRRGSWTRARATN